jgi:hypothetical protein
MGPMSDVTMLRRLCVDDFGHAMLEFSICTAAIQKFGRFQPDPSQNHQGSFKQAH